MDLGAAGLLEQPFPTHGKPLAIVSYASKAEAFNVLSDTCEHRTGLSLLQGPTLSGKSTLIRSFAESMRDEFPLAVVNGKGLNTNDLLTWVLRQFGFDVELSSTTELLGLLRVYAMQQAATRGAPLLIIENSHELNPSALHALCELSELQVRSNSALKLVLVSDRSLQTMISSTAMTSIAKRVIHNFHLRPMNRNETKLFLHTKLRAAGSDYPELIFPEEVSREIWQASGGWPGIVDRVALLALAQAQYLPVAISDVEHPTLPAGTWTEAAIANLGPVDLFPPEPPRLIVTNNGSVMSDLTLDKPRTLVGRSDHNDISINSRFISRHHALLVRHGDATFLMDLNSSNGTFVNSKRVSNHVLIHDDVITIGHHRIKFNDTNAMSRNASDDADFADTVIMKTLDDMRKLLAQENTALLPTLSEDLPTIQT
jgi:general secretion pathway protein A